MSYGGGWPPLVVVLKEESADEVDDGGVESRERAGPLPKGRKARRHGCRLISPDEALEPAAFLSSFRRQTLEPGVQGLNDAFRSRLARSRLVEDIRIERLLDAHPNGPKSRKRPTCRPCFVATFDDDRHHRDTVAVEDQADTRL